MCFAFNFSKQENLELFIFCEYTKSKQVFVDCTRITEKKKKHKQRENNKRMPHIAKPPDYLN